MTDRESELIVRLMNGNMEAFDELMPNAPNELREKVWLAVKNSDNPFAVLLLALLSSIYCCGKADCSQLPNDFGFIKTNNNE